MGKYNVDTRWRTRMTRPVRAVLSERRPIRQVFKVAVLFFDEDVQRFMFVKKEVLQGMKAPSFLSRKTYPEQIRARLRAVGVTISSIEEIRVREIDGEYVKFFLVVGSRRNADTDKFIREVAYDSHSGTVLMCAKRIVQRLPRDGSQSEG